jgi:mycothiol S-conjugate amidase
MCASEGLERSERSGSLAVMSGTEPLCLLQVHAHPDDEASKGAGTTARYAAEGVHNVLVCCTGGEAGEILNPGVEHPGSAEALYEMRMAELRESVRVLGYDELHLLGYHDSGMPDTETNARPDNFANAPLEEAVERLVRIIRAERPQVIITYAEDRAWYPHPDHIRVHEISLPAFDAAGDPNQFPDSGEPWEPSKLYYTGFSRRRIEAMHDEFQRREEESPYAEWFKRGLPEFATDYTTFIDVGEWLPRRRAALLAHRTQVDPEGHWMRLPDDDLRRIFPWEEFLLARSRVDNGIAAGEVEDDLFAGLRADVLERRA